jgi:hypothetical protein
MAHAPARRIPRLAIKASLCARRYLHGPSSLPVAVVVTVIGIDPPVVTERPCDVKLVGVKLVGVKLPVLVLVVVDPPLAQVICESSRPLAME